MLSHEERIAEVKRRIAEKEHQKRLRQARIAAVSGGSVSAAATALSQRTESVQLYAPASALPQDKKERQRTSTSKIKILRCMFFTCLYCSLFAPSAASRFRCGVPASPVMA